MISLHLHVSHGPPWFQDIEETVFVRGYCFDELGYFYEGAELLEYFSGINSQEGFERRLQAANGCFSVIWKQRDAVYAAVDRLRSLPLLWCKQGGNWHLANEMAQLPVSGSFAEDQADVFLFACHTFGHATLWEEVSQLQGGEYVILSEQGAVVSVYFQYRHRSNSPGDKWESEAFLRKELRTIAEASFQRLIQSARNSPLLIPLSGGYDSRFIAAMLKQLGYESVICFTYGRPESGEVAISRQVARQLGYPWHFIEYTEELLGSYLEEEGQLYQQFAANGTSIAHEQDFFAIRQLLVEEKIPADSLLVPGFGGDVLAGSWFPANPPKSWSRMRFIRYLMRNRKYFAGTRKPRLKRAAVTRMIHEEIPGGEIADLPTAYSHLQYWGLRNRMSKFLVNAVRVYDFWDLGWRLPFFDHAWMEFWMRVPDGFKQEKRLYLSEASEWLFKPMGIDYHLPQVPPSGFRKLAKQLLPAAFVDHLKARWVDRTAADVNNQDTLSRLICQQQGWDEGLIHRYDLNYLMGKAYLASLNPDEK